MPVILDKPEEYTVQADDTLESIAQKAKEKHGDAVSDWKLLARYNWGTDKPREVVRALAETVGVKLVADMKLDDWDTKLGDPEKIKLAPDADLAPKLKLPKPFKKDALALNKTHTLKLKPASTPANAVSIPALDKWFIPKEEACEIKYRLEGEQKYADKVQLDVYGSKYCECTDWNKGLGTYGSPDDLIETPIFKLELNDQAAERQEYELKDAKAWKGLANTDKGILSRKTGTATERYINVAFSPYTAHLRYYKADGDKKAQLILEAFWPQFEETKTEQTVTVVHATKKASWSNAAKADRGAILIKDKDGQRVHLEALPEPKLAAGNQEFTWNGNYREDALNSKFGNIYIDEDKDYKATITTLVRKPQDDSLKIKWEFKHTGGKLERGLLQITDGAGKLVFQKPLVKGKLGDGKQDFQWDGKYAEGLKNSKDGDKIIPEDMPYRVQLQAHTGIDKPEGLALAAMHTEVRLYVHPKTFAPADVLYDSWTAKNSVTLGLGSLVPGDAPAEDAGTRWYQYKLADYGFHPGPVTGAVNDEYKTALREFKRSVPADGSVAAPNFTRLALQDGKDIEENDATKTALKNIRDADKRKWFGSLTRVDGNNDAPDLTDAEIKSDLPDPAKDVIVWVDDRQYYTEGDAKDEDDKNFLTGTDAAKTFGLMNYRNGMETRDGRIDTDAAEMARPWIPLKVQFHLLSRTKSLTDEVALTDEADKLKTFAQAVGPLRVDWTFDELPPDIHTINAGYDQTYHRARKFVHWILHKYKDPHTRKDTKRDAVYTNCKETYGGIRPDTLTSYYKEGFGTGDQHLAPWQAAAIDTTESVATVVHDHIADGQKDKTKEADATKVTLFEPLIGAAGAYFNPSRIAGDGYRVRAAMQFEKFTNYEFPNLEALKARYPTPPQAHTARLRVWRRASIRGYLLWAANPTGHWTGLVNQFRNHFRAAHVYFVHEGGAAQNFAITDVFDENTVAHQTRYKNILSNNMTLGAQKNKSKMTLKGGFVWPWSEQDDFGWNKNSPINLEPGQLFDNWLNGEVFDETWRKYRDGLLLAVVKEIEKKGVLRGHLFIEFKSSPKFFMEEYECGRATNKHKYWFIEKGDSASSTHRKQNSGCPSPSCGSKGNKLTPTGRVQDKSSMPLPAVGIALGATWLFTSSDAETWVHEVAHHRHLEHAGSAPGAQYEDNGDNGANLHDNENNTSVADWVAAGFTDPADQRWDKDCIMSYSDGSVQYFCGKCLLRNRGWRVTALAFPGSGVKEP
jgi:flagellar hook assembly protein FlgD